jgi:hypothetical protein
MNNIFRIFIILFFLIPDNAISQVDSINTNKKEKIIYGFVRAGFYGGTDDTDHKPYISSAFSDFALKVESKDELNFKAYGDLRFRYGAEFLEPVSRFDIREAFISLNGRKWDLFAGQKIIKWGRADFTNPTSKLNPINYVSRSAEREDMDLGNLLAGVKWFPSSKFSFEAIVVPYYRSSTLLIDPIVLPEYVIINQIESLITEREMFSYGLKADLNTNGLDMSLSWFDGYDPMPGMALTDFNLDLSGPVPVPYTEITMTPYKIRNLGFDFETALGNTSIRGEAAWTFPYKSFKTFEYVPCQEIKWVAGIDWTSGNWRFTWEYSGKTIPDFVPTSVDPIIGMEPDFTKLAILLATPGFDMEDYVRQQVGSFNRLYNYQLEKLYHSAGLRIETDLFYGKLTPSVFTLYNFTSHDFLVIPELNYKPADGLTISAGLEFYSGRKGSVYDIIDKYLNCFRAALKVDF